MLQLQAALALAEQAVKAAELVLAQARAALRQASHDYHDAVIGARGQVISQFGPDSTAVSLIGLTRKSERKRPVRRKVEAQ